MFAVATAFQELMFIVNYCLLHLQTCSVLKIKIVDKPVWQLARGFREHGPVEKF